jgi:glycosyltransferase involved in cell wall biosynthesis
VRPIRILELRSVRGTGGGPEKTILFGAARANRRQFVNTVCYLRAEVDPDFHIDERADALGLDYVSIVERRAFDWAVVAELRQLVRDRAIDIIHAHDYKTDLLALLLAQMESAIPLTTAHGWTGHTMMERWVYYPGDKLILRYFPHVIAVSSEIRRQLLAWGCKPERVQVVLNGIDHLAFQRQTEQEAHARTALNIASDAVVIGSVGRLEPQKRFDLLIEAFARLRAQNPRAALVIAGEGSLRSTLQTQIDALRLTDSCRLIGHYSNVVLLHHALDLFVQSSAYEGTPNVVLEAMALGTPVIATNAGGTAELIRNGTDGLIIPSGSAEHLYQAMATALGDPTRAAAWTAAARRRTESDLSFENRMARVEAIYERLVFDRRPPNQPRPSEPRQIVC